MILGKSYFNILDAVYMNPGIRLNEIIKKSKISAATAKSRINELLERNIITEERIKKGKKTIIRNFYPNFETEDGLDFFVFVESEKRYLFFERHSNLMGPFKELAIETAQDIDIILVFGSFSNFSETKESDLDILIIQNEDKKDKMRDKIKKIIERSFVTINYEISPRLTTISELRSNLHFFETIKKNHIVIKGARNLIMSLKD